MTNMKTLKLFCDLFYRIKFTRAWTRSFTLTRLRVIHGKVRDVFVC